VVHCPPTSSPRRPQKEEGTGASDAEAGRESEGKDRAGIYATSSSCGKPLSISDSMKCASLPLSARLGDGPPLDEAS
jgi:hypothetical protein